MFNSIGINVYWKPRGLWFKSSNLFILKKRLQIKIWKLISISTKTRDFFKYNKQNKSLNKTHPNS